MGTHPIFESDFDCLTALKWTLSKARGGRPLERAGRAKAAKPSTAHDAPRVVVRHACLPARTALSGQRPLVGQAENRSRCFQLQQLLEIAFGQALSALWCSAFLPPFVLGRVVLWKNPIHSAIGGLGLFPLDPHRPLVDAHVVCV